MRRCCVICRCGPPGKVDHVAEQSYRETFSRDISAARYDEIVYATGSSADLLWQAEYRVLRPLAAAALKGRVAAAYLDFACGTGRVGSRHFCRPAICVGEGATFFVG